MLVCLFLLLAAASAQARQTPPASSAPSSLAASPAPRPAQAKTRGSAQVGAAPRAPVSPAPNPPRQVVTVVHRLSGWKLLAWLAANGPPTLELDELPTMRGAHTNIVAGYVYQDGRSVVARLPQAEVELDSVPVRPAPPALLDFEGGVSEPEYLLVTAEGRRVEAKFVGLDSSTGLTLLEAKERLLSDAPVGDQGDTEDPAVGQRVLLYAPAPAPAARGAQQLGGGYIYLSIDQREGLLSQVRRGPSGKPARVVMNAGVPPEWTGAVAANEVGEVVGIVSQSRGGETQIVPLAAVVGACERVLKQRASVPQPWLGARGDAAFRAPLAAWVNHGWLPELARPHIEKRQGVFLTSVAPGTPAALAGLKAGDLIAGVGAREVRSVEDLSLTLKEAGVGSKVDLTVWRALEPGPLKVSVELKGVKNPALATAEAEERALRDALLASRREVVQLRAAGQRLKSEPTAANAVELKSVAANLVAAQERVARLGEQLELVRAKIRVARSAEADTSIMPAPGSGYAGSRSLQTFGLSAIGLSPRSAARLGAAGGLLVVAVRPESPAAAGGVQAGDVIETVNGAPLARLEMRPLFSVPETSTLTLGLVREGRRLTVSFSPGAGAEQKR